MVLHLTLILGLICAGVAAGEASSGGTRNQGNAAHLDTSEVARRFSRSISKGRKDCNECLRTTIKIIKKASVALEKGYDFWAYDPCNDFPSKQKAICLNVIDHMKQSGALNILNSRKICTEASYCTPKNKNPKPKPKPKPRPTTPDPNTWRVRHGNEAKTQHPPTGEPTEIANVENQASEENKVQLKLVNPQVCQDCKAILKEVKKLLAKNNFFPHIITSICENYPRRSDCYEMIYKNEVQIINLIHRQNTNHEICTAIKWCSAQREYPYCKACQYFLKYKFEWQDDGYYPANFACKYLQGNSKRQCMNALKAKKQKMAYLLELDYGIYSNCAAVQLCSHLVKDRKIPPIFWGSDYN